MITLDRIKRVLLPDGWHDVAKRSLSEFECAPVDTDDHDKSYILRREPNTVSLFYTWTEQRDGRSVRLSVPRSAILAVEH